MEFSKDRSAKAIPSPLKDLKGGKDCTGKAMRDFIYLARTQPRLSYYERWSEARDSDFYFTYSTYSLYHDLQSS